MKRTVVAISVIALLGLAVTARPPAPGPSTRSVVAVDLETPAPAAGPIAVSPAVQMAVEITVAPPVPPAHRRPAAPTATSAPTVPTATSSTSSAGTTAPTTAAARTAYLNALYLTLVPARQRAALAGRYQLGYDLPGLACGTGCTGLFGGQARSSFDDEFFREPLAYQRNTLAHEAAHAYGFLFIAGYAEPSWAAFGGWAAQFHTLDRSFAGPNDAEAWAACVAWSESGFNDRIDQIAHPCTSAAAVLAIAQIT